MARRGEGDTRLHRYPPFDVLVDRVATLPRKQKRIARALLDEPELVAFASIREVAGRLQVNAATVVRFAQSLGYGGYSDLQAAVRRAYLEHAGLEPPEELRRRTAPRGGVVRELAARQRSDLERLYESVTDEELSAVCDALETARRVVVSGEGAAAVPARLLARTVRYAGIHGEFVPSSGVDRAVGLLGVGAGDVVVGFALWLPFRSTVDVLRLARSAGAGTIAIAATRRNPAMREASHSLLVPGQGVGVSFSVLASVALVEAIAASLATRRPEVARDVQQALRDRYVEEGMVAPLHDAGD